MTEPTHVLCRETVEDDLDVYNIRGKYYEIYAITADTYEVAVEPGLDIDEIIIKKDDPAFLVVFKKED